MKNLFRQWYDFYFICCIFNQKSKEKTNFVQNFDENKEEKIRWKNLKVGHLILLNDGDICPTDTLILDCSDSKLFVETSNIDGLSFNTVKFPLKSTYSLLIFLIKNQLLN